MTFLTKLLISLAAFLVSFGLIFGLLNLPYRFGPYICAVFLGSLLANMGRRAYTNVLESKHK
ncbi:xanthosine utilization system XapX-like protein [Streptococcus rupicaprae]|uniref:Xanthosine utilization system XapX-like protein n=1 Tax=Streptococcus rupicaprae TaxID=759619 RepID=A0ABV2FFP3_9STRE